MRVHLFLLAVLTFISSAGAHAETWALRGKMLGPNGFESGTIIIEDNKIRSAGKDVSPPVGVRVVDASGLILPGFIDLHNHLTWNLFPRWRSGQEFHNRYEWQALAEYDRVLNSPHARLIDHGLGCDANLYAEVKALAGGATSVSGSNYNRDDPYNNECIGGLARNLDLNSGFGKPAVDPDCANAKKDRGELPKGVIDVIAYEVFPFELSHTRIDYYLCELAKGNLRSLVIHLSEGKPTDASARREFNMLLKQGLLQAGVVLIHATALAADDFATMKKNNAAGKVGLIWSPRSNDELYRASANIAAAQEAGIAVAIAPDWSPTGSAGMLQEISYAAARYSSVFDARSLLEMATSVPAIISRLDDKIGKIAAGYYADLTVVDMRDAAPESVVKASPADVRLVVVDGQPLYGDQKLLHELLPKQTLDDLSVCGSPKSVFLGGANAAKGGRTWKQITKGLQDELNRSGITLAEFDCD
jgi:5-methylthioadenosine/S-adenosylhomocysteine deaminase